MFTLYLLSPLSLSLFLFCADDDKESSGVVFLCYTGSNCCAPFPPFFCNASDLSLFGFTPALNPKQIKDM